MSLESPPPSDRDASEQNLPDLGAALATIKAQRERFSRLAAASGIGVWYCDLPFSELNWDEKVKEYFWLPPHAHVTIDTFYSRIHPEDRERTRGAIEASIRSHTRYDTEYRTTHPDDPTRIKWVRAMGWTDYDAEGKPIRFDGIALDITAAKAAEERLRRSLDELHEERQLRERYVSTLTHDLRNPLASAKMNMQLAARKVGDPDRVIFLAMKAVESIDRADRMIQDLLDVTRIRAGLGYSIEVETYDLVPLIREVCDEARGIYGADFRFEGPDSLIGVWSPKELRRLVENLTSNAAKYGDTSRPITVHLSRTGDRVRVRLRVHNYGDPIPEDDLPRVFDGFQRSRNSAGKKGWGLGLNLVKGVAEAHGGTVSVESAAATGTTFTVELPSASPPARP